MRKFRGKQKGEWLHGYGYIYCHKYFGSGKAAYFLTDIYGDRQGMMVDGDTVGQYIFKKDKNKKEIYEGDIVKYTNNQNGIYEIGKKMRGVIVFNNYSSSFCCKNNFQMDNSSWMFADDLEVIGNIYDNPELLEEEKC